MRRLATPAWLLRHVIMVALVVTFLRLGWWQLSRAEGGNGLSIGYTLEWPAFAIFVIVVWWREVRMALRNPGATDANAADSNAAHPDGANPSAASSATDAGRRGPLDAKPEIPGVSRFDAQAARAERDARIARTLAAAGAHSPSTPPEQGSQST